MRKAVANSTFERECPYEGRQRFFFGVGGSGRRPFKCVTLNSMLRVLRIAVRAVYLGRRVHIALGAQGSRLGFATCAGSAFISCEFYALYVLYTCMLRLLYMLCVLSIWARAHNVRDLSQEPLRHASNLCGPFLRNRASCCVPGPR